MFTLVIHHYDENDPDGRCSTKKCLGFARFTAVGPQQANAKGALAVFGIAGHQNGDAAISPEAFGLPFPEGSNLTPAQYAQRVATQALIAKAAPQITIDPLLDLSTVTGAPLPPYGVSDIGDINVRESVIPQFDIYGFSSNAAALKFGSQIAETIITEPTYLQCPSGFFQIP